MADKLTRPSSQLRLQEPQSLLVEFIHLLIDWGVRASGKDQQLRVADAVFHRLRKAIGQLVLVSACDEGWGSDPAKLCCYIMRNHCVRLLQKRFYSLGRTAADKICQRLNIVRLGAIQLRCKTPGKDS